MREILFRGKRIDNGEWIEGWYVDGAIVGEWMEFCEDYSTHEYWWQVIPETVGQYTGLTDKNGKRIWEGDIVRRTCYLVGAEDDGFVGIVKFQCGAFYLESFDGSDGRYLWDDVQELEVIGNIHDKEE